MHFLSLSLSLSGMLDACSGRPNIGPRARARRKSRVQPLLHISEAKAEEEPSAFLFYLFYSILFHPLLCLFVRILLPAALTSRILFSSGRSVADARGPCSPESHSACVGRAPVSIHGFDSDSDRSRALVRPRRPSIHQHMRAQ